MHPQWQSWRITNFIPGADEQIWAAPYFEKVHLSITPYFKPLWLIKDRSIKLGSLTRSDWQDYLSEAQLCHSSVKSTCMSAALTHQDGSVYWLRRNRGYPIMRIRNSGMATWGFEPTHLPPGLFARSKQNHRKNLGVEMGYPLDLDWIQPSLLHWLWIKTYLSISEFFSIFYATWKDI